MRITHNWNKEELEKLYWQEEKTLKEIGTIYHKSADRVGIVMKKLGIPRRSCSKAQILSQGKHPRYRFLWNKEELERLYCEEKKSLSDIGKIYGCSKCAAWEALVRFEIPIRTASEAQKLNWKTNPLYREGHYHPSWKGGKSKTEKGYILVYAHGHPYATKSGYVLEHRLVMEKKLGRYLLPSEKVHHVNGIKDDNRSENLQLISQLDHTMRGEFCANCALRKEIRLLQWEMKQLREQLQYKLREE